MVRSSHIPCLLYRLKGLVVQFLLSPLVQVPYVLIDALRRIYLKHWLVVTALDRLEVLLGQLLQRLAVLISVLFDYTCG